jgi:hypothetical protein
MVKVGKYLFLTAAGFNFLVGLAMLFGRSILDQLVPTNPVIGTNLLVTDFAACLSIAFGLVFIVISMDPVRYRPFIVVSIISKLMAVAVAAFFLIVHGAENWQAPSLAVSEFFFMCSFWRYYSTTRIFVAADRV